MNSENTGVQVNVQVNIQTQNTCSNMGTGAPGL